MIDLALGPKLFITSKMDEAIQELDLIFSTDIGEAIGDPTYGANWYQFLYTLSPMEDSLKRYVQELLMKTYYCKQLDANIEVQYIPGEVSCSYLVKVTLTDFNESEQSPNRQTNKVYNIR